MLYIPQRAKDKKKKRTPFRRTPRQDTVIIQPRDIAIFKMLSASSEHAADPEFRNFRYLTREFIYALLPEELRGGYNGFIKRFTTLLHGSYLRVPSDRLGRLSARRRNPIKKDTINELGENARALLGGTWPLYYGPYEHKVLIDIFRAYLAIALSEHPEFRFTKFSDLMQMGNIPDETRALPEPYVIILGNKTDRDGRVLKDAKGNIRHLEVEPDYPLCRIEHQRNGEWHSAFLLTEIDRGTETLKVIKEKIRRYDIALERAIRTQYGVVKSPTYVLFFTVSETRRNNMAALAKSSKFADRYLFAHVEGFDGHEALPTPHADFLTTPMKTGSGTFRFSDI